MLGRSDVRTIRSTPYGTPRTALLAAGLSLNRVAQPLGHVNLHTTSVYTPSEQHTQQDVEEVEKLAMV